MSSVTDPQDVHDTPEIPPLPPDATHEQIDEHWYKYVYQGDRMPQLTLRAVLMGGFLGMLMSSANLYTTLKIGWAFGVAITACVMSYVIWNLMRLMSGYRLTPMSILENNCMQSTASAAGYSTGSTIATAFGSLLILQGHHTDWKIVTLFTLLTGAMGVLLAIPLKRQMINHERLPFPSGIAAAATLRSLYSKGQEAMRKAYSLLIALFAAMVLAFFKNGAQLDFVNRFFTKLESWKIPVRIPDLVPEAGFHKINGKSLNVFGFDPSVLLVAAGMIVGPRVSYSMLAGACLLYFWVGPELIKMDMANEGVTGYIRSIPLNSSGSTYMLTTWALWGGTAIMVFSSLTAVSLQWRTIVRSFSMFKGGSSQSRPAHAEIEVPTSWLIAGMIPISLALLALQWIAFEINIWLGIIAVAMSLVLSLVACRATGETDVTPIGAMGKVMQLLFAVLSPGNTTHNLISAGVAANSASSSADLLTDLKSGYLLGANPRKQFIAQFIGIFFGTVAVVPAWFLLVPNLEAMEKDFPAPATQQWTAVARVMTEGAGNLPDSAKYAILIGALAGIALPVIEFLAPKLRGRMPSAMGLGLAWVVPFAYCLSFAIGATIAWLWHLFHKRSQETFNVPIASGLVAGEALMSAGIAMTNTAIGLYSSSVDKSDG